MKTVIAVVLFAGGVALLMQSSNFATLHHSKIPRQLQGSAGRKSWGLVILGSLMTLGGLGLFIASSIKSY